MTALKEVTDAEFDTIVLGSESPVLVDFWADWCGPCHLVGPILEELNAEYGDRLTFMKMDVDANPATPVRYQVAGIPAMYVFKGGEQVAKILGAKPKAALLKDLHQFIAER
jgi:thioredoxin 1